MTNKELLKKWVELTEEVWEKGLIFLQSGDVEEDRKEHFINTLVWAEGDKQVMIGICHSEPAGIRTPSSPFQWVRK